MLVSVWLVFVVLADTPFSLLQTLLASQGGMSYGMSYDRSTHRRSAAGKMCFIDVDLCGRTMKSLVYITVELKGAHTCSVG